MPTRQALTHSMLTGLVAMTLGLLPACLPSSVPSLPEGSGPTFTTALLSGRIEFPERGIQLTTGTVVNQATVTLYNSANQAMAVGRTDALGNFTLDPGTGFVPSTGDTFVLDAYKTATTNGVGSDVVRLRTVVAWGGAGWNSVSGTTILLNAATTAVCIIQSLNAGTLHPRDTLNTVSGTTITNLVPALASPGPAVSTLVTDLLTKDQDPVARISLLNGQYLAVSEAAAVLKLDRFQEGSFTDAGLDASGYLQLAAPKPLPRDASSELAYFQCQTMNNDGAGVVATDGTYLYVKTWNSYANSTANTHVYKKIGTGFNSTVRGQNYGTVGTATAPSLSAFYWNGGIYSTTGTPNQLNRVDVATNAVTTVTTGAVTLDRYRGLPGAPEIVTTDGTYVYNLSFGITARTSTDYNGWTVQVLNPANGFSLVRQFTMDNNSYYTDGVFCDGTYIYPVEWTGTATPARIRRYRLSDGALEYEGTFLQTHSGSAYNAAANDPISGAWDPVNKVFWIGNLTNDYVHLLRGGTYHTGGSYTSRVLDSGSGAPHYGRLRWTATTPAGTSLAFKVRSANTLSDLAAASWYGPTGTGDAYTATGTVLNAVHARHRYLQVQATLATTDVLLSPKLLSLSVEVLP